MNITETPQNEKYPFDIVTVGDGVTVYGYSDAYAGTVFKVSPNGRRVWIREDNAQWAVDL